MDETERLELAIEVSNIKVRKAAIFAIGWWLRNKHGFRKYPDCYKAAKNNIGCKSVVFGIPRWPTKYERGPLQNQMRMFYQLMEQSLQNDEWRIRTLIEDLVLRQHFTYHKHIPFNVCRELWWDCAVSLNKCKDKYSYESRAIAVEIINNEDFQQPLWVLCDSLEETEHDFESGHLRTGVHTPACPVLRKIAGIK